jgi:hypothetical protein
MVTIFNIGLNESIILEDGTKILRVPDHWIYIFPGGATEKIPFSYDLSTYKRKKFSKETMAKLVSDYYNLPEGFYKERNRKGNRPKAKRILVRLLYDNLKMNHYDIAVFIGYRHHSSSVLGLKEHKREIQDPTSLGKKIKQEYEDIYREYLKYRIK